MLNTLKDTSTEGEVIFFRNIFLFWLCFVFLYVIVQSNHDNKLEKRKYLSFGTGMTTWQK